MRSLLVIADDRALTKFVAQTLLGRPISASNSDTKGNGWDISRAHSALEAAMVLTHGERRFDAIVCDQNLPDKDVLSFLDELRKQDATREIPIVVMSERGRDPLTRRLASECYLVAGFIDKPVTAETLRRGLRSLQRMRTVLIVDRDTEKAEGYAKALRKAGFAVSISANGQAAHAEVNRAHPDAAVISLQLDDVSGVDLCAHLKKASSTHSIQVLLHGDIEALGEGAEIEENAYRADDFLAGEIGGDTLVERLSSLVGRGSSRISSVPPIPDPADQNATKPMIDRQAAVAGVPMPHIEGEEEDWERNTPSGEAKAPSVPEAPKKGGTPPPAIAARASSAPDEDTDINPPASASPSTGASAKRSTRRVPCHLSVSIKEGGMIYQSETLNISDGGILITTDHPLQIGTRIDLTLRLPNREVPIAAVGKVAWINKAPSHSEARTGVGVKFSRIDPADLKLVVDYVNHLSRVVYVAP